MRRSCSGSLDRGRRRRTPASVQLLPYVMERLENRTLFALMGAAVLTPVGTTVGADVADPDNDVVYVAEPSNDRIIAINTDTGNVTTFANTAAPVQGLAVSVDDSVLYASEPTLSQVQVFPLPSLEPPTTLSIGVQLNQIVALANGRFAGIDSSGIQIFDGTGTTLTPLFTLTADTNGLLRSNISGTILYSRERGQTGVDSSIHEWDTSQVIAAPTMLANIAGPVAANSTDFAVNPNSDIAYFGDAGNPMAGLSETVLPPSNAQANIPSPNGPPDAIAALDDNRDFYVITTNSTAEEYNRAGTVLGTLALPDGHQAESLVETPNNVLIYTFGTGVGIISSTVTPTLTLTLPNQLVFENPQVVATGNRLDDVFVAVEDSGDNVLTGDNNSVVTLSLVSSGGMVTDLRTVLTQGGVADFRNLTVSGAGTYTLEAADGTDNPAFSDPFTIKGTGTGSATTLSFSEPPTGVLAGAAISPGIQVSIVNQAGVVQTGGEVPVTLSIASGAGTLRGTDTVEAVNGVATFNNVILDGTGAFLLSATDAAGDTGSSGIINVTASASADHLAFVPEPVDVTPGVAAMPPVEVEIEDSNGNVVSTNANVSLSINSGPGVLGGTVTVPAVEGVATFSKLQLSTLGGYTLAATSAVAAPAISSEFQVAYRLAITQAPQAVVAGQRIAATVMVDILDQNGNIVTDPLDPDVSLAIASGPSFDLGGTTTVAAVNGEAIFRNLSIDKAGAYTVTANDNDASAPPVAFTAIAGTPAQLVFLTQPASTNAGTLINPIVVAVEDNVGNVVINRRSVVKLTVISTVTGKKVRSFTVTTASGEAFFKRFALKIAGTFVLKATDVRLTPAVSEMFTVDPAVAALRHV